MARLINPSSRPVTLPTGHVAPRDGALITTNDVLRCPDNAAYLRGQILSGALAVEYDPDPQPEAQAPRVPAVAAPETPASPDPDTPEPPGKGKAKG